MFLKHLIGSKFPLMFLKHLISSKLSLDLAKTFNQLKASKTMNAHACSEEKHF